MFRDLTYINILNLRIAIYKQKQFAYNELRPKTIVFNYGLN